MVNVYIYTIITLNQLMDFIESLFGIEPDSFYSQLLTVVIVLLVLTYPLYHIIAYLEVLWITYVSPKPFYKHLYFKLHKLTSDQLYILYSQFSFYRKLDAKQKKYFEHRVAKFIQIHEFLGKSGLYVTDQHRVLIAATAVMLTFGYRSYKIKSLERFLIYPDVFKSKINKAYHKGEYNPRYKAIVFSWKDFLEGYEIDNDNFNLGIHEIVHAIHHDFIHPKNESISAIIFMEYYNKIKKLLNNNSTYREKLVNSKYIRNYAFTNNFEFIAVVIESFFETPEEFENQFPELYNYVKRMLNFDFKGY